MTRTRENDLIALNAARSSLRLRSEGMPIRTISAAMRCAEALVPRFGGLDAEALAETRSVIVRRRRAHDGASG